MAKAAVQAVAGSDNVSSALVVIAASQITATVKVNANVEITSTAMTAAVEETDSDLAAEAGSDIADAVDAVLTETAPVVSVSASPSKLTAAGTVTLSADITAAADTEILWTQLSGPSVAISNATTASASVSITEAGNYFFSVTVKNKTGFLSTSKTVNVGFELPVSSDAEALLNEGIAALVEKDFNLAMTKFEAAYQKDESNSQTTFWYAFMSLVSISTDPDTVSLMKDRIGMASYPGNMNDLFSEKWFNGKYYNSYWGFAPASESDEEWVVRGDFVASEDYTTGSWVGCYDSDMNYTGGFGTFTPNVQGSHYAYSFTYNGTQYSDYSNPYPYNAGLCYVRSDILDTANFEMFPALETPDWASNVYDSFGIKGESSTQIAISSYPKILLLNLISRNASGFNGMLDSVLAGMYGTRFDRVVSLIDSLPDSASITLPPDLIAAYTPDFNVNIDFPFFGTAEGSSSDVIDVDTDYETDYETSSRALTGDSTDASGEMPAFAIRKAELKALSASMQMSKSLLQLLSSYNLDYSIAFMQNEFWNSDGGGDKVLAALYKQENPIAAGLLGNRSESSRSASKNTFIDAMDDFSDALTLFASDVKDQTTLSGMLLAMTAPESVDMVVSSLGEADVLVGKLRTSVANGGSLYVNPAAIEGGSITALLSTSSTEGAWECTPSALWSTDILNPAKLFETTGTADSPEGLKFYGITFDDSKIITLTDINATTEYFGVALKIKLDRVEELFNVPDSAFPDEGYWEEDNTIMFPIITMWDEPEQLSADQLALIDWMK
ncbi:MAG: hypothetical protein JXP39_04295 [Spirochaetales bacterium]|nr:hypothetical protein [Spirochaetales bacterium]